MKKITKITIILFIILSIFSVSYTVSAAFDIQDIFSKGDTFISTGAVSQTLDESEISAIFIPIAQVLVRVGTIILAIAVVVLGIQYMVATPDKKAVLKDKLVGLAIAAIVIGGAQIIWSLLVGFFE